MQVLVSGSHFFVLRQRNLHLFLFLFQTLHGFGQPHLQESGFQTFPLRHLLTHLFLFELFLWSIGQVVVLYTG